MTKSRYKAEVESLDPSDDSQTILQKIKGTLAAHQPALKVRMAVIKKFGRRKKK